MVGEHSSASEGGAVRPAGGAGREDADMSSDKRGEKPLRRKPKVSWARLILPGLVGS